MYFIVIVTINIVWENDSSPKVQSFSSIYVGQLFYSTYFLSPRSKDEDLNLISAEEFYQDDSHSGDKEVSLSGLRLRLRWWWWKDNSECPRGLNELLVEI